MSAPESDTDKKVKPTTTDIEKDTNAISITAEKPLQIDPKLEKHSHDADEALKAMEELHREVMTIDEATNKRLLRTIDWHLMPIMCFIYGMNYLDSGFFFVSSHRLGLVVNLRPSGAHRLTLKNWDIPRNCPVVCQCHGH